VAPPEGGRGQPDGGCNWAGEVEAPVSRAEQLAEHGRYRGVVVASGGGADEHVAGEQGADEQGADEQGADEQGADEQGAGELVAACPAGDGTGDRRAWSEALPGLRAAWAEHKERYPDQARAVARTEADGSWGCGEQRRLDPEQNTEAGKAHADLADEASRYILPALRRIEAADPERKLAGLEHMVKGEDRLKEKLADILLVDERLTTREALSKVPDAVRFTLTYSPERYTESVLADVERLKAGGFSEIRLKNLWHTEQYKGINSQWRNIETGTRFEMQFHTPDSLQAKELTHEAYERLRRPEAETSQAERRELEDYQRRVNELVGRPPHVETIRDFPERPR
jgi:hypothetical protein